MINLALIAQNETQKHTKRPLKWFLGGLYRHCYSPKPICMRESMIFQQLKLLTVFKSTTQADVYGPYTSPTDGNIQGKICGSPMSEYIAHTNASAKFCQIALVTSFQCNHSIKYSTGYKHSINQW